MEAKTKIVKRTIQVDEEIKIFIAKDGKEFTSEQEAIDYENNLQLDTIGIKEIELNEGTFEIGFFNSVEQLTEYIKKRKYRYTIFNDVGVYPSIVLINYDDSGDYHYATATPACEYIRRLKEDIRNIEAYMNMR